MFFFIPLNYLQLHLVQNPSKKAFSIHEFLSVQQRQLKNYQEQN
jgi:hypothetical protein